MHSFDHSLHACTIAASHACSGMPDSQTREPGFESPLLSFRSLDICVPSTVIGYLAIDGGGNVVDFARNCCVHCMLYIECLPGSRVGAGMNRSDRG